jgi:hypothetical protein
MGWSAPLCGAFETMIAVISPSRGLGRDIQGHLRELYGIEASPQLMVAT